MSGAAGAAGRALVALTAAALLGGVGAVALAGTSGSDAGRWVLGLLCLGTVVSLAVAGRLCSGHLRRAWWLLATAAAVGGVLESGLVDAGVALWVLRPVAAALAVAALAVAALSIALAGPVRAADPVKIGFMAELSGPQAALGQDKLDAFMMGEIDEMIEEGRARWLSETISAEGELGEGLAALRRSLLWNMVYDSVNGRVVTPVSRNWCKRGGRFGDYVLFEWDTFFAAMQYGLIDKVLTRRDAA